MQCRPLLVFTRSPAMSLHYGCGVTIVKCVYCYQVLCLVLVFLLSIITFVYLEVCLNMIPGETALLTYASVAFCQLRGRL